MDRNFQRALPLVLKHEGGFVNHPDDPGGATNKGVTIATFRRYVKANGTVNDLRNITDQQVATVYYRHYWATVQAHVLPSGLDYAVFDFAVNSGPSRAAKFLQRLVGVNQDGRIGPITLAAVAKNDADELIVDLCDMRLAWLKRLRHWPTFGRGWTRRVNDVKRDALKMVGDPADVQVPKPVREVVEDAAADDRMSTTEIVAVGTGATGVVTAVNETVEAVNDTTTTLVSAGPWVLLGLVTAGFGFYIWRERRRKRNEARAAKAALS